MKKRKKPFYKKKVSNTTLVILRQKCQKSQKSLVKKKHKSVSASFSKQLEKNVKSTKFDLAIKCVFQQKHKKTIFYVEMSHITKCDFL